MEDEENFDLEETLDLEGCGSLYKATKEDCWACVERMAGVCEFFGQRVWGNLLKGVKVIALWCEGC